MGRRGTDGGEGGINEQYVSLFLNQPGREFRMCRAHLLKTLVAYFELYVFIFCLNSKDNRTIMGSCCATAEY